MRNSKDYLPYVCAKKRRVEANNHSLEKRKPSQSVQLDSWLKQETPGEGFISIFRKVCEQMVGDLDYHKMFLIKQAATCVVLF